MPHVYCGEASTSFRHWNDDGTVYGKVINLQLYVLVWAVPSTV